MLVAAICWAAMADADFHSPSHPTGCDFIIAVAGWAGCALANRPSADPYEALEKFARTKGGTVFHGTGTCRMGTESTAAVDPQLRVNGVRGLRVIDASVMPTMTSANTNAAAIMIGEHGAALVRQSNP